MQPRPGQWLKFKVSDADPELAGKLRTLGGHETADGHFVGLFHKGGKEPLVTISKPDGSKLETGGEVVPDKIYLVKANGHNVPRIIEGQDGGVAIANVWFAVHQVQDLQPLTDKSDLPPGYPKLPEDYKLLP